MAGAFRSQVDEEVRDGGVRDVGHLVQRVAHPELQRTHFRLSRSPTERKNVSGQLGKVPSKF